MPKIVTFADGFTSLSAPSVETAGQEVFPLLNNQAAYQLIDSFSGYTSVFALFEIERIAGATVKRQTGEFIISFDGTTYTLNIGNYQGDNLLKTPVEGITLPEEVVLNVTSGGVLQYKSGNLVGQTVGNFKLQLTRVTA